MSEGGEGVWLPMADAADLEEDDAVRVDVRGHAYAVFNSGGEFYVTDDRCTHQEASLSDGYVQDDTVECPRHQGVFHLPSGKAMCPPLTRSLRVYPARVDDGKVWARVAE